MAALSVADLPTAPLTDTRAYLLDLLARYAYQEGNFTLSSGQPSPYYINGKQVTLRAEGSVAIARLILDLLPPDVQGVGGLTLGADPMVSAVSTLSVYQGHPIAGLIVRKEAKGHGTQAYIEGPALEAGAKVAILEDVVTTGKSAWLAVERLRAAGYVVDTIIAIVDRQQGGREFYEDRGLTFKTLFTIADVQQAYRQIA